MKNCVKGRIVKYIVSVLVLILIFTFAYFYIDFYYEIKKISKYSSVIEYYSLINDIEKELVLAIISIESSFIESAKSNKGAIGLMQILPSTERYAADIARIDRKNQTLTDGNYNICIGTFYLKYLFDKFENTDLVLIAYNAGEGNLAIWLEKGTINSDKIDINKIPFNETKKYVRKVNKKFKFYKKISPLLFDKEG